MTPQPAEAQAVEYIYSLLRLAAARRQPVAATYMVVYSGCFVPMCWAENQADSMCFAINLEEVAVVA